MKTESIILASAILLTGLMAGIFFTWSNAVKPGIGKLSDIEYLRSLQSMNRVILNKAFLGIFMGTVVAVVLAPIFHFKIYDSNIFWLFIIAFVIYWVGVFGVTIFGNIPLNEKLDKTNLETTTPEGLKALRMTIEDKWNKFNLIRSYSSVITFILLIISSLLLKK